MNDQTALANQHNISTAYWLQPTLGSNAHKFFSFSITKDNLLHANQLTNILKISQIIKSDFEKTGKIKMINITASTGGIIEGARLT